MIISLFLTLYIQSVFLMTILYYIHCDNWSFFPINSILILILILHNRLVLHIILNILILILFMVLLTDLNTTKFCLLESRYLKFIL